MEKVISEQEKVDIIKRINVSDKLIKNICIPNIFLFALFFCTYECLDTNQMSIEYSLNDFCEALWIASWPQAVYTLWHTLSNKRNVLNEGMFKRWIRRIKRNNIIIISIPSLFGVLTELWQKFNLYPWTYSISDIYSFISMFVFSTSIVLLWEKFATKNL